MDIASLLKVVASVVWIIGIGVVILVIVRAGRGRPIRRGGMMSLVIIILAALLSSVSAGIVFINPQERGVVISAFSPKGVRDDALEPGLRWVIPYAESVITYPISRTTYTMSATKDEGQIAGDDSILARTADGQEISVDASVIYQVDPQKVVLVHIQWQNRYGDDLVRAQARGIIRGAVSQFGVEDIVSRKRFEMTDKIRVLMSQKLEENGLLLIDFVLRNIAFSKEYAASVEQKQIAEQLAQQAKFTVEQRRQEAEQARQVAQGRADAQVIESKGNAESRLIQAEAEGKSLELINKAIKDNKDLLTYQYISKLSPNIQAVLLPNNAPFIFPFPTLEPSTKTNIDANKGITDLPDLLPMPKASPMPTIVPTPKAP